MPGQGGGGFQPSGSPNRSTNFAGNFQIFTFDGFDGLNTKPTRPAIEDQEMFWCDNFQPLGRSNLVGLYDAGTAIYTSGNGAISFFNFGNIADTKICMVVQSDGSIVQVNTANNAATVAAPAGTIINPTAAIGMSQWGSQYILMDAPQTNGYFIWDGSTFYQAGTVGPAVNITNSGFNYSSPPTIVPYGGHGSGAAFAATVSSSGSITAITVTSGGAGSGYTATDFVNLAFQGGGNGTANTAIASATLSNGGVGSVLIVTAGSGYSPATTQVTFLGGGGFGATGTVQLTGGSGSAVSGVTIVNPGQGYSSPPTVIIADTNNPVAQANVPIMPFGVQGTAAEVFSSRVWLMNGAAPSVPPPKSLVTFSAPGNPADFSSADGSGLFKSTDSFLRVGFHSAKQSNGFLYLIGDSSVNYISGVTTSGNPPITTFSNQNVDPQIGSPWPNTVQVYGRAIVFANTYGVHALYGGAVQKVSNNLDGIYTTVTPNTSGNTAPSYGSFIPSSAVAIINGIHVYMLLLPIIDTRTGQQVNKLLCWNGSKWWTAQPSVPLTFVASQEINSVLTAYGTDGKSIYPLFATASSNITKTVQSKLWDNPHYLVEKHSQTVRGLLQSQGSFPIEAFTISVDTEQGSSSVVLPGSVATWTNIAGAIATWANQNGQVAQWLAAGLGNFIYQVDANGVLMGLTLTTQSPNITVISLAVDNQQYQDQT